MFVSGGLCTDHGKVTKKVLPLIYVIVCMDQVSVD